MRFLTNGLDLHLAVSAAARALPKGHKASDPILNALKITVHGDGTGFRVTGFDRDTAIQRDALLDAEDGITSCPPDEIELGSALVSGRLLAKIVASLPATRSVELATSPGYLHIEAGRSRYSLPLMVDTDYPSIPHIWHSSTSGTCDTAQFVAAVTHALEVTAEDVDNELTGQLSAVRLEARAEWLYVVATDSYKLAYTRIAYDGCEFEQLIPGDSLNGLVHALADDDAMHIHPGKSFAVTTDNTRYSVPSLDGRSYPDWRRVLQRAWVPDTDARDTMLVVHRAQLLGAARRLANIADKYTHVGLSYHDGGLVLKSSSEDDRTTGTEELDLIRVSGPTDRTVTVNARYLIQAARSLPTESLHLDLGHGYQALLGSPFDDRTGVRSAESALFALMPVQK